MSGRTAAGQARSSRSMVEVMEDSENMQRERVVGRTNLSLQDRRLIIRLAPGVIAEELTSATSQAYEEDDPETLIQGLAGNEGAQAAMGLLRDALAELEEHCAQEDSELAKCGEEIANLERRLAELEGECVAAHHAVEEEQGQIENEQTQREQLREALEQLRVQLTAGTEELERMNGEKNRLTRQREELSKACEEAQQTVAETMAQMGELKRQIRAVSERIQELNGEVQELAGQILETGMSIQTYEERLTIEELREDNLRQQEQAAEREREHLQSTYHVQRDQRAALERELARIIYDQRANDTEVQCVRHDQHLLEQEISGLVEQLERVRAEAQREEELEKQANAEVASLEGEIHEAERLVAHYEDLARKERARNDYHCAEVYRRYADQHRTNVNNLRDRVSQARSRATGGLSELQGQVSSSERALAAARQRLSARTQQRAHIERQAQQLQSRHTGLCEQLATEREREDVLSAQTRQRDERVMSLQMSRQEAQQEVSKLHAELRRQNAAKEAKERELRETERERSMQEGRFRSVQEEHARREDTLRVRREEYAKLQQEIESVRTQIATTESAYDNMTFRQAMLEQNISDSDKQEEHLNECLANRKVRRDQLAAERNSVLEARDVLKSERVAMGADECKRRYRLSTMVDDHVRNLQQAYPRLQQVSNEQLRDAAMRTSGVSEREDHTYHDYDRRNHHSL